ncbi:MAG: TerB family tellurite resistance protein [Polyangiaceae bacterium]
MDSKIARCLLISKVLVADGIMTENERAFLNHYMDKLGLNDAEREQVVSLEGWDEAEPIVKAMSDEEKHAVLDAASHAALADGTLSPLELGAVRRIAAALGLE